MNDVGIEGAFDAPGGAPDLRPGPVIKMEPGIEIPNPRDPWIHRSAGMQCKTCLWYIPKRAIVLPTTETGRCRRHAPVVCKGYPVVFPTDWCGDHKLDENKV